METAKEEKSSQARAASCIRSDLKEKFPRVKFAVRSSSYAGGDSVDVSWTDGPTYDDINSLVKKYQYGSFDGMQDLYEYTNTREDIPQSKYVQCQRTLSDEVRAKTWERLKSTQAGCENATPDSWIENAKCWGSTLIYRELNKISFTEEAVNS